jgi:hypothetical protein
VIRPSPGSAQTACVIFVHMPKTAGQTLNAILARQYDESATVIVEDRSDLEASFARVARQRPVSLVRGHLPYGIHQILGIDAVYITMLREPVARVISTYEFIKRTSHHPLHEVVRAERMTLSRFVESDIDREEVVDGQTRLLSGVLDRDPDEETLAKAIDSLERVAVVGLTERFDESVLLMRRRLGWDIPLFVRKNVAPRTSIDCLDPLERALIEQQNRLDLRLYRAAAALLDGRIRSAGASFQIELLAFRALNRLANSYVALRKGRRAE